jgi:hypothetical protein
MRIMHDVHLRSENLVEYLRMDRGGLIMIWPPENKPRNMAGPPPNLLGKSGTSSSSPRLVVAWRTIYFRLTTKFDALWDVGGTEKTATVQELRRARAQLLVTRMSLRAFKDSHLMAWRHVGPFPPYVPSTGWNAFYTVLRVCRLVPSSRLHHCHSHRHTRAQITLAKLLN